MTITFYIIHIPLSVRQAVWDPTPWYYRIMKSKDSTATTKTINERKPLLTNYCQPDTMFHNGKHSENLEGKWYQYE